MFGDNVGDDANDDVGNKDHGSNNAGNDGCKGDGRDASRKRGGGLPAEDAVAAAAAVVAVAMVAAAAYCRGCLLFIVKMFLCGIFTICGGDWRGHTFTHTLVTLEVCRRTFGCGR
jgi:hypothetical protein